MTPIKVGVDIGTTSTKFVWKKKFDFEGSGEYIFVSTADTPLQMILQDIIASGVKSVQATGIGPSERVAPLEVVRNAGNLAELIKNEICVQAKGTRRLLNGLWKNLKDSTPADFLVISIGTGTSYALNNSDKITHLTPGNSLGGGTISGLASMFNIGKKFVDEYARCGKPMDIFVKDMAPPHADVDPFTAELIVSNFGKGQLGASKEDICATIVHLVASQIMRDVMRLNLPSGFPIVCVGAVPARFPTLVGYMDKYAKFLNKTLIVPPKCEFAGAMGAYIEKLTPKTEGAKTPFDGTEYSSHDTFDGASHYCSP